MLYAAARHFRLATNARRAPSIFPFDVLLREADARPIEDAPMIVLGATKDMAITRIAAHQSPAAVFQLDDESLGVQAQACWRDDIAWRHHALLFI